MSALLPDIHETHADVLVSSSFVMQPREIISAEHAAQQKAVADDLSNLSKKVCLCTHWLVDTLSLSLRKAKYLEKQLNDAQSQLKDIVSCS